MNTAQPLRQTTCARCHTALEEGDLRCSVCALAVQSAPRTSAVVTKMRVLRCDGCGAAIKYNVEAQAPKCAFCAAVMRLETPEDPVEQVEYLLPFAVSPQVADAALRRWLSRLGWFRPSNLGSSAAVDHLKALHWAAWLVDAQSGVSWTADSDAGARSADWAPHAGQVSLPFRNLVVPATRGLTIDEAVRLTSRYELSSMTPIVPSRDEAATIIEAFDVQRSAARRTIAESIEATAAARLQHGVMPGSRFRHVNVAVLLESLQTRRVGLPAYVLAYRYRGKVYRAVVHGQDPNLVLGTAPYSIAKILLAVAIGIAVMFVAVWAVSR